MSKENPVSMYLACQRKILFISQSCQIFVLTVNSLVKFLYFVYVNVLRRGIQNWIDRNIKAFPYDIPFWMYFFNHFYKKFHYIEELSKRVNCGYFFRPYYKTFVNLPFSSVHWEMLITFFLLCSSDKETVNFM